MKHYYLCYVHYKIIYLEERNHIVKTVREKRKKHPLMHRTNEPKLGKHNTKLDFPSWFMHVILENKRRHTKTPIR